MMNAIDLAKAGLTSSLGTTLAFLEGFSDTDMLVRPAEGANHAAWQLGHLILSERFILGDNLPGVAFQALPAGFEVNHGKERAHATDLSGWLGMAGYAELMRETRTATLAAVEQLSEAQLDHTTQGRLATKAPKLGNLLVLVGNHDLMHAGQFTVIRRKLGKPVLF